MKALQVSDPQCIATTGDTCGEGILWDGDRQSIYWCDINRFLVHRYSLADAAVKTWFFTEPVTCVMQTSRPDTLALAVGSGIALWNPRTAAPPVPLFALPGWPFVRSNDAAVGPDGSIWLGTMRNNVQSSGAAMPGGGADGILYRVNETGAATEWRRGLGISNTLVWSPDQSTFYFGDSTANCLWSYEYNVAEQSITRERPFFQDFSRGKPDGSTIDKDGYIWNCRYDGGCIARIAPDGKLDRVIEVPVSRPTNCTFGGAGGNVLYITSAYPAAGSWERFGGCLLALETNTTGLEENRFKLPPP